MLQQSRTEPTHDMSASFRKHMGYGSKKQGSQGRVLDEHVPREAMLVILDEVDICDVGSCVWEGMPLVGIRRGGAAAAPMKSPMKTFAFAFGNRS